MAMRRLIVIDPQTNHQALYDEDRSVVLIWNGEIHNYCALRVLLVDGEHIYLSQSQCEAIVHLYEKLGVDCVEKLNDTFAFALWDTKL